MWEHLKEKNIKIPQISSEDIDKKLEPVLREMEKNGIKIDCNILNNLTSKIEKKIGDLEDKIHKLGHSKFNISSTAQLAEILFVKLKLPKEDIRKTKTGFSTAASELHKLERKHKIIPLILEYRELTKLLSTYLKPLPLLVDEDSRLHTHYGQDTSTGRLTSQNPNLQNIPIKGKYGEQIRNAFVAEKDNLLIAADYSQIELRIVACLSQDQVMMDAFNNNKDIHAKTASEIFNVSENKINKNQRRIAKVVNFGVLYGMSPYGLSQALDIDQEKASLYIKKYFEVHTGIKKYCEDVTEFAKKNKYVETLFGRKRSLKDINSKYRNIAEAEERMAVNSPVQGTAADMLKLAMIKLDEELKKFEKANNCYAKLLLTIHDELIVESNKENAAKIETLLKETMENIVRLCVPINVESGYGKNWGEIK